MRLAVVLVLFFAIAGNAQAAYITIKDEVLVKKGKVAPPPKGEIKKDDRKRGIYFPITNNSVKDIDQIFGRVYGHTGKKPYGFRMVNNPQEAAIRITPGRHHPGTTAVYWFNVPRYRMKYVKYGLLVYDVSISFGR